MTSSTHVGENVNFSCMKAAYSQRSIEKAVSEGRISARDIAHYLIYSIGVRKISGPSLLE
jgi:hypothetical protein